jgi:hypothetical protein
MVFGRQNLSFDTPLVTSLIYQQNKIAKPLFLMVPCCRLSQFSAVLLSLCRECVLKVQGMYGARSAKFSVSRDEIHHVLVLAVHILFVVMYGVIKF